MFEEEDRLPLTLSTALREISREAESCDRTIERAGERSQVIKQFCQLENYTDILMRGMPDRS